jgi:hypothetical protein
MSSVFFSLKGFPHEKPCQPFSNLQNAALFLFLQKYILYVYINKVPIFLSTVRFFQYMSITSPFHI